MSNHRPFPIDSYTRVSLGYNRFALIDTADAPLVVQYRWRAIPKFKSKTEYYAAASIHDGGPHQTIYLHRLLMNPPEGMDVDHRNGDTLDCRRENMRICTEQQNTFNRAKQKNRKYPYIGIRESPTHGRWCAQLQQSGQFFHLGTFASQEEAARAYDEKAKELRGEFARLNFPEEEAA